ncbi:YrhC family protein [Scopulibacillus cellulosilyticus]|uniref:YrhC family protein n=1 Tax=Scopulibacillus cellulosilyticus TaxID=2665665 RepID=A0ABW2PX79_9BACL
MNERELKNLKHKAIDYQRFSFIFMFLSVFLYIGTLIPFQGKTAAKSEILTFGCLGIMIIALLFFWRMKAAKKKLEQN